jgi:hypothetical protein
MMEMQAKMRQER